jgi:drug/metabolite transporter (DMT)-like permease
VTPLSFALIFTALIAFVVGQLVLKRAMEVSNHRGFNSRGFVLPFSAGLALMTVSFFLILGLLQRFDLSYIYPFQGLSVIIISVAAAVVLREKLTAQLVIGAALISAGIILVSMS